MKIVSRQTIFFCVVVCANNFFPAASSCKQFLCVCVQSMVSVVVVVVVVIIIIIIIIIIYTWLKSIR